MNKLICPLILAISILAFICASPKSFSQNNIKFADSLFSVERYNEAITAYHQIIYRDPPEVTKAYAYFRISIAAYYLDSIEKSTTNIELAQKTLVNCNAPDTVLLFEILENQGAIYNAVSRFNDAYRVFKLATEYLPYLPSEKSDLKSEYYNNYAFNLDKKGEYIKAINCYKKAIEIDSIIFGYNHEYVALSFINIGHVQNRLGNYDEAINHFLKALEIYEALDPIPQKELAETYNHIGATFTEVNDHNKAIEYYKGALGILQYNHIKDDKLIANLYNNLGISNYKIGNLVSAEQYFNQSLRITDSEINQNMKSERAISYHQLGILYFDKSDYDFSRKYINKAIKIFTEEGSYRSKDISSCYQTLGEISTNLTDFQNTIKYLNLAIKIIGQEFGDHTSTGDVYYRLGNTYLTLGDYSNSLSAYRSGLEIYDRLDSLMNNNNVLNNNLNKAKLCHGIAKSLEFHNKINNSEAEEYFINAIKYAQELEPGNNILDISEKQLSIKDIFSDYLNFLLKNSNTSNEKDAKKLLSNIEKFKNIILTQLENRYLLNNNKYYQTLSYSIENKRAKLANEILSDSLRQHLATEITELNIKLDSINKTNHISAINQTSNSHFLENQYSKLTILDFFVTDSSVLAIKANTGQIEYYHLNLPNLKNQVISYFNCLKSRNNCAKQDIINKSAQIYQQLKPIFDGITIGSKIIVLPDEYLYYLPFESLIKNNSDISNFSESQFLIADFTFQYEFSLNNNTNIKTIENNYLGIAPKFYGVLNLIYNTQEIEEAAKSFSDAIRINSNTDVKHQFIENYPKFGVIHFATHAEASDAEFTQSKILLDDPVQNKTISNSISFGELSQLDLRHKLVILSGCQTGYSNVFKAQGLMSLGKSLRMAGCQNHIATLWNLDDHVALELSNRLFINMHHGNDATKSLHQAKLEYLNSNINDDYKNPYYWANFKIYGNSIIEKNTNILFIPFIIFIVTILFFTYLLKDKIILIQKKQKKL